ncbi:hypothetical protein AeMF1_011128 [Aphanomyces euteiches]|nr:hypothetical protein AeMF1_011128 [Aphanomyces euteiches]KAH9180108.1 hypothetical protein AeNC1_017248 [Aphanomyces euteiches]
MVRSFQSTTLVQLFVELFVDIVHESFNTTRLGWYPASLEDIDKAVKEVEAAMKMHRQDQPMIAKVNVVKEYLCRLLGQGLTWSNTGVSSEMFEFQAAVDVLWTDCDGWFISSDFTLEEPAMSIEYVSNAAKSDAF